jgi:tripartite-type tricarboxylate transporter receptor subunit TctC
LSARWPSRQPRSPQSGCGPLAHSPAGGSIDTLGRVLAGKLAEEWGQNVDRFVGGSPEELASFLKNEIAKWAEVAKSASLTAR